jgi:hypothetical protein
MNKRQRNILFVASAVIILIVLFPPFHVNYSPEIEIHMGYSFLFHPPKFQDTLVSTVDIQMLLIQLAAVILIGGMHWYIMKDKK